MWTTHHELHERLEEEAGVDPCSHEREVLNREWVGYAIHAPLAVVWQREAEKLIFIIIFRKNLYEGVRNTTRQ